MSARALMVQGTGSDVGKSLIVAGLCRAAARRGLVVRPFKPQNMSNNAAVTVEGGEIGRAQALQARACGVAASVHMNPVLLKPQGERQSQVVVQGRVMGQSDGRAFQSLKPALMPAVLDSFARLKAAADLVLVEGAGSPAEINLRQGDLANMGFALAAGGVPVVLVGDIDRGGVIASLVGTHALLAPAERALVRGFVINRFRGDASLFAAGLEAIECSTGWRGFGILPYVNEAARLPAEDAVALDRPAAAAGARPIRIAVPRLAHIANFDDFDPLAQEPDVALRFVPPGEALPGDADLVILPGSKTTLADLSSLLEQGWDIDLKAHLRRKRPVLGICGGFQMLGRRVADPDGIEGPPGAAAGLGLLEVETVLGHRKALAPASGTELHTGAAISGYVMHMGITTGPGLARPLLRLRDGSTDGAVSADGLVAGCYVHGLFASDDFRAAFLARLRAGRAAGPAYEAAVEAALDGLADRIEAHLDVDGLLEAAC